MKEFTNLMVDDLIKLKFGSLVTSNKHRSFVSNKQLGKVFGVSQSEIR